MSDALVHDATGTAVRLDVARRAIRSLGTDDEGVRALNARGEMSREQAIDRRRTRQAGSPAGAIAVLGGCIVVPCVIVVAAAGGSDDLESLRPWVIAIIVVTVGVCAVLAKVLGDRRRDRPAPPSTVVTLRGHIESPGPGGSRPALPTLDGRPIVIDRRWVGFPVVAHVLLDDPVTVLSADLDLDVPVPIDPVPDAGGDLVPVRTVVVRGDDQRARWAAWLVGSSASTALAAASLASVGVGAVDRGSVWIAVWLLGSVLTAAVHLALWRRARHDAATTVTVDPRQGEATIVVERGSRPPVEFRSADLTGITRFRQVRDDDEPWTFRFGDTRFALCGQAGSRVANALREVRPDVVVDVSSFS
jgi:hypothetical protein